MNNARIIGGDEGPATLAWGWRKGASLGGTGSPCRATVQPGKEQLGFNVAPPGILVTGPEWMPEPLTAALSTSGDWLTTGARSKGAT